MATTDPIFSNTITNENVTRSLKDAAKRLENAAKELREFAEQISENIDPAKVEESLTLILPTNVKRLAESVNHDTRSATGDLFSALLYSSQLRVTV